MTEIPGSGYRSFQNNLHVIDCLLSTELPFLNFIEIHHNFLSNADAKTNQQRPAHQHICQLLLSSYDITLLARTATTAVSAAMLSVRKKANRCTGMPRQTEIDEIGFTSHIPSFTIHVNLHCKDLKSKIYIKLAF